MPDFFKTYFSLEGKLAIMTGVQKGIGKAMAVALASCGADILGVSRSLPASGSEVQHEVEARGRKFYAYRCDFGNRASLYDFIEQVRKNHDRVDILVNNAGTIHRDPIISHEDEDWDKVIETNLNAPYILSREIGKGMIERGSGKIIFTASLLSFQGGILVPGYAASKGGLNSLIKAFANEWADKGLQINGIAPGYIATDNTEALRKDASRSASILARIPAGRWGTPEDIAGAVVFLASGASDYVNGTIITVDGGWMGR